MQFASATIMHWSAPSRDGMKPIIETYRNRFPLSFDSRRTVEGCTAKVAGGGTLSLKYGPNKTDMQLEYVPKGAHRFSQEQMQTVMSGMHQRLGSESQFKNMAEETLRYNILQNPTLTTATDSAQMQAFVERFVESDEVGIDLLFKNHNDALFYHDEFSLCFIVPRGKMDSFLKFTKEKLGFWSLEEEKHALTEETEIILFGHPNTKRHRIVITFSPRENQILVGGLGTDTAEPGFSLFNGDEPNTFKYFVNEIDQRIMEYSDQYSSRSPSSSE